MCEWRINVTGLVLIGESQYGGAERHPHKEPVMAVADRAISFRENAHNDSGLAAAAVPAVWLSGQEAAKHVGVSWPTLRQFIIEQSIPHVRLGRRWKIEAAVLDEHLRRAAAG
jgi:excisionase family DNA binding protein